MRDKLANVTSQMAQLENERNTLAEAYEELEGKFEKNLESETQKKDMELKNADNEVSNVLNITLQFLFLLFFFLKKKTSLVVETDYVFLHI